MKVNFFRNRLPSNPEIFSVFSIVVFFVHSWSVRGFLYKLPSFLFYFSMWDILSVFSYMMAFALLESILVTMGFIFLGFVFPEKWMRQGFVYKSFLVLLVTTIASITLQGFTENDLPDVHILYMGAGMVILISVCLILLFHKVLFLQKTANFVVDGFGTMAYFYIPIGVISLLVVLVRNLS